MLKNVIQPVYDRTLRPLLPRKVGVTSGVVHDNPRLLDINTVEYRDDWKPRLQDAINQHVTTGDTVVFVGGGYCIGPTIAAQRTGPSGNVIIYEAAHEMVERCERTVKLNAVADWVDIRHAIVGTAGDIWGSTDGADRVAPADLPAAGVMVVDCEGGEREIVANVSELDAETLVVESHAQFGVSGDDVASALGDRVCSRRKMVAPHHDEVLIAGLT